MSNLALEGIERKAEWVRRDASSLARYVRMLEELPDFDTKAEHAAKEAESALTEALLSVKLARSELAKKRPVNLLIAG